MTSVTEWLDSLPENDRKVLSRVRALIRKNLPKGYEEIMYAGKIAGYVIPLSRYPKTYNKQPLHYVAFAKQKNFYTLYMMGPYGNPASRKHLEDGFRKAGKKLDMGKSCVHFKSLDDLPLDVIGENIASIPVDKFIEAYEDSRLK
ncbi:MAG TPA: DUF1801 domain-containing protein [Gemmatimonadaceae bacterium]|nr:DUF1801 domain-containing protein [Gemmatimonadaceae bacterium]